MKRAFLFATGAAALLLQACSSTSPQSQAAMAGACQVRRCACGPQGWTAFSAGGNVPVLWQRNGDAYCPDGFSLHLVEEVPGRTAKLAP